VDRAVIALSLGHESLETTHVYVEADLATKERALNKLAPMRPGMPASYRPDDKHLAFLATLRLCRADHDHRGALPRQDASYSA